MALRAFASVLVACLVAPALAFDGPPMDDEDRDELCETIGETANDAISPRDRMWFKESCVCIGSAGCGRRGSERWRQRVAAALAKVKQENADRAKAAVRTPPQRAAVEADATRAGASAAGPSTSPAPGPAAAPARALSLQDAASAEASACVTYVRCLLDPETTDWTDCTEQREAFVSACDEARGSRVECRAKVGAVSVERSCKPLQPRLAERR